MKIYLENNGLQIYCSVENELNVPEKNLLKRWLKQTSYLPPLGETSCACKSVTIMNVIFYISLCFFYP